MQEERDREFLLEVNNFIPKINPKSKEIESLKSQVKKQILS